jgi:RNA methyltransferase, TrmH family
VITDPGSSRVKAVVRLTQKDARQETGLFLLEGPQGLKELVRYPEIVHEVFVTESANERYASELSQLRAAKCSVELVSDRVMEKLSETQTPQGVVAVVHQLHVNLDELLAAQPQLLALLDRVQDPGNAGTILRASDAAGADGVLFSAESVDVYNGKVVRSTAGSLLHLPVTVGLDLVSAIPLIRESGIQVFIADAGGTPITQLSPQVLARPTAWVFGNEAGGISPQLTALADQVVSIPIYGSAESLNLATAASICLYTSAFAQQASR